MLVTEIHRLADAIGIPAPELMNLLIAADDTRPGFEPKLIINKIQGIRKENRKGLFGQELHPTDHLFRIEK